MNVKSFGPVLANSVVLMPQSALARASMGIALSLLIVVSGACGPRERCPGGLCAEPLLTMYYKETPGVEPWAADPAGSAAPEWKEAANADFESRGLKVMIIERVSRSVPSAGYALRIAIRPLDQSAAEARCLVKDLTDPRKPAALRTDCAPLYRVP
jgi:hypothetical protein